MDFISSSVHCIYLETKRITFMICPTSSTAPFCPERKEGHDLFNWPHILDWYHCSDMRSPGSHAHGADYNCISVTLLSLVCVDQSQCNKPSQDY